MNANIAVAGLAFAILASTPAGPSQAATFQLLGKADGLSFSAVAPKTEVWLQVTPPAGVDATAVTAKVRSVLFDGKPDNEILGRFTADAKPLAASKDDQPSIVLKITEIDKLLPGVYSVTFGFTGGNGLVDPLTLNLDRRAALLAPAAKQVVEQTISAFGASTLSPESIWITSLSDRRSSELRGATTRASGFAKSDGKGVSGSLGVSLPAKGASAGESLEIKFKPTGFEVGTAIGKVWVDSPDLKAPFTFDVEVRTRLSPFWLVFAVLFGIVASYVLRVLLQHRLELSTVKEQAVELLMRVGREMQRTPDLVFGGALSDDIEALKVAALSEKVADINAAVTALAAKLATAQAALQIRLEQQREAAAAAAELAAVVGPLPMCMRNALAALRDQAELAVEKVRSRDADGAERTLKDATRDLRAQLEACGTARLQLLAQSAARYAGLKQLLDERMTTQDRKDPLASIASASAPALSTVVADISGAKTFVDAWVTAARQRQLDIGLLASFIENDAQAFVELAQQKALTSSATDDTIKQTVLDTAYAIAAEVRRLLAGPEPFDEPEFDTAAALSARKELLLSIMAKRRHAPAAVWPPFEQQIATQHFFTALADLPEPSKTEREASQELKKDKPDEPQQTSEPANSEKILQVTASTPVGDPTAPALGFRFTNKIRLDSLGDLQAFGARTRWKIATMTAIQTVSVAAILGAASFAIFGEKFIGTFAELAGLFFWGFTSDLSVAKLADMAGGLAAKTKI